MTKNGATQRLLRIVRDKLNEKVTDGNLQEVPLVTVTDIFKDEIYGHEHRFDKFVSKTDATCTALGCEIHQCRCGEQHNEEIPMLDHTPDTPIRTEATCTEAGSIVTRCAVCNQVLSDVPIDATGHSYVSSVSTAATCTSEGVRLYTCSKCGNTYTEPIPMIAHNYGSNDRCTGCGQLNPNHTHSYDDIVTLTAATCNADGTGERVCRCGDKIPVTIPATGHNFGENRENDTCANCGVLKQPVMTSTTHSFSSYTPGEQELMHCNLSQSGNINFNAGDPITFRFWVDDEIPESFTDWRGTKYIFSQMKCTVKNGNDDPIIKYIDVKSGEREVVISFDHVASEISYEYDAVMEQA